MWFLLMACSVGWSADAVGMRAQADALQKKGNWREAYELRVKVLRESDDPLSGDDLRKAAECLEEGGDWKSIDSFLGEFTESRRNNAAVMEAAGEIYL